MDRQTVLSTHSRSAFPSCAHDGDIVPAGKAASELTHDRFQTAKVGWIVMRDDSDVHGSDLHYSSTCVIEVVQDTGNPAVVKELVDRLASAFPVPVVVDLNNAAGADPVI